MFIKLKCKINITNFQSLIDKIKKTLKIKDKFNLHNNKQDFHLLQEY